ncbi:hypothetical protein [Celerinatantimonas sp. YJH-8]|uniref:hypothetical protein n=1 Tax=Celerinatantimonas sp. YJH-8 TaxID=3228714 RepID=UPI0038C6DB37
MLEQLQGRVANYNPVTKTNVQLELVGECRVIELQLSDAWVINRGDQVIVAGEVDPKSGRFSAYAYKNQTRGVFGKLGASAATGGIFVIASILFFWAIFPLMFHLPAGLKMIALGKKVNSAFAMIQSAKS